MLLLVLLLIAAAASIWAVARFPQLLIRIGAGVLALVLAAVAGMAVVNDYFGYYQTWTQLQADLSGNYTAFTDPTSTRADPPVQHGKLETVTLAGKASGITRKALVYLPPQYFQPRYRHTKFPVVELLHGTPGSPSDWVVHLNVPNTYARLLAAHEVGPMVLVMPTMSVGRSPQECVNAPGALDDTYITRDVRSDITARFRVSRAPAEWGIAGFSSGGYCAANLALRHRAAFGAAGIMDGYFRPTDGPAAAALHYDPAAEAANNPLAAAAALPTGASPLPAFWLAVGTGNAADYQGTLAFVKALHGVERVGLYREPGGNHNYYAWLPATPHLLAWMWKQIAPPALRVAFPIAGPVHTGVIAPVHSSPTGRRPTRLGHPRNVGTVSRSCARHGAPAQHPAQHAARGQQRRPTLCRP